MNIVENLYQTLGDISFHDGVLEATLCSPNTLEIRCFCWHLTSNSKGEYSPDKGQTVKILFHGVSNLNIYDEDTKIFLPYNGNTFKIEDTYIDYLDYENEYVVFGEAIRFKCTGFEIIQNPTDV